MSHFDVIKARIAQGLLPDGYNIVKGESIEQDIALGARVKDSTEAEEVKDNTEPKVLSKSEVMVRLDMISAKMVEMEDFFKADIVDVRHEHVYKMLDRAYNNLHIKYKAM